MENGILIEILNSLHKLLGLPVIQGTIDPQHLDCIQKCNEVTHFYKTECLAKCGINPAHINTILDTKLYTASSSNPNANIDSNKIPNSTTPHENLNNSSNQLPRVTELFHNLTKENENQPEITKNLTELHKELIRRIFDSGGGINNNPNQFGGPTLETVDVKYFYLFAFMALTPVLVLFYCCYKQFTKPLTTAYSDSNNHHSPRHQQYHRHRRRVYLGQLPPRENSELSIQNIHSSTHPSNAVINESRIRTVSLPAYEDCVKSSLSDLEDHTYSDKTSKIDSGSKVNSRGGSRSSSRRNSGQHCGNSGENTDSGRKVGKSDEVLRHT